MSWASYSELENRSPKMNSGFVGGVFAEFEFGDSRLFSIRPEVDWLVRGTKINDSDLDYRHTSVCVCCTDCRVCTWR